VLQLVCAHRLEAGLIPARAKRPACMAGAVRGRCLQKENQDGPARGRAGAWPPHPPHVADSSFWRKPESRRNGFASAIPPMVETPPSPPFLCKPYPGIADGREKMTRLDSGFRQNDDIMFSGVRQKSHCHTAPAHHLGAGLMKPARAGRAAHLFSGDGSGSISRAADVSTDRTRNRAGPGGRPCSGTRSRAATCPR